MSPVTSVFLYDRAGCDIHQMIGMGLDYEIMDVVLALNGICIGEELSKKHA